MSYRTVPAVIIMIWTFSAELNYYDYYYPVQTFTVQRYYTNRENRRFFKYRNKNTDDEENNLIYFTIGNINIKNTTLQGMNKVSTNK